MGQVSQESQYIILFLFLFCVLIVTVTEGRAVDGKLRCTLAPLTSVNQLCAIYNLSIVRVYIQGTDPGLDWFSKVRRQTC